MRKGEETRINWELLSSRDGRAWSRPLRELFFPDAGTDTWRHQVFKVFANPPIERDGRLLIYYGGKTGAVPLEIGDDPFQALCLATLRKDGFVSLRAGRQPGEVVTKPLKLKGPSLSLNYAARSGGSVRVEILSVDGSPAEGFTLEENDALNGDHLDRPVTWNGRGVNEDAAKSEVRLRFVLRDADLYSFRTVAR